MNGSHGLNPTAERVKLTSPAACGECGRLTALLHTITLIEGGEIPRCWDCLMTFLHRRAGIPDRRDR